MLPCFLYTKRVLFTFFVPVKICVVFPAKKLWVFFPVNFMFSSIVMPQYLPLVTFSANTTPSVVEFLVMVFSTKKNKNHHPNSKNTKKEIGYFQNFHHLKTKHTLFSGEIHTRQMGDGPPNLSQMRGISFAMTCENVPSS